jgi:hypothetical protein
MFTHERELKGNPSPRPVHLREVPTPPWVQQAANEFSMPSNHCQLLFCLLMGVFNRCLATGEDFVCGWSLRKLSLEFEKSLELFLCM